jgi:hypothetical protein
MNEREQFEKWYAAETGVKLAGKAGPHGRYKEKYANEAWLAWQAARATPALPQVSADLIFDGIKHGDDLHQRWLRQALDCIFAGLPVPKDVATAKLALPQEVEEWIAENGLQMEETLGGFGEQIMQSKLCKYPCPDYIREEDLRAYLSGMAIVPVETQKDAERYRFIRNKIGYDRHGVTLPCGNTKGKPEETDAAIDRAMLAASKDAP